MSKALCPPTPRLMTRISACGRRRRSSSCGDQAFKDAFAAWGELLPVEAPAPAVVEEPIVTMESCPVSRRDWTARGRMGWNRCEAAPARQRWSAAWARAMGPADADASGANRLSATAAKPVARARPKRCRRA
ncbi:MAG: hypothetical protein B7Z40_19305 [Bosea sp. 12-68-7]|nr:MAG: hypothetical protein B7Z40_19305 [Bosea sp. 12-68-7]